MRTTRTLKQFTRKKKEQTCKKKNDEKVQIHAGPPDDAKAMLYQEQEK